MSAVQTIRPTITFVAEKPSSTGKTYRVLLSHPTFERGIAHYANIPVDMTPEKWNVVEATTVKLGEVQTTYTDITTGEVVDLQKPQRQVSFYGEIALCDGDDLPPTTWVDKRKPKSAPAATATAAANIDFG